MTLDLLYSVVSFCYSTSYNIIQGAHTSPTNATTAKILAATHTSPTNATNETDYHMSNRDMKLTI